MLIRNARLRGYLGLTDLRLMHGAVQEIGTGLQKGLYESELDLMGDELSVCPPDMPLPRRYRLRTDASSDAYIVPGAQEPFRRIRRGETVSLIDSHSAD